MRFLHTRRLVNPLMNINKKSSTAHAAVMFSMRGAGKKNGDDIWEEMPPPKVKGKPREEVRTLSVFKKTIGRIVFVVRDSNFCCNCTIVSFAFLLCSKRIRRDA